MTGIERVISEHELAAGVTDLAVVAPTKLDYALYILDLSLELSRLADRAALPEVVGHTLRMAARAAQDEGRTLMTVGPRPDRIIP